MAASVSSTYHQADLALRPNPARSSVPKPPHLSAPSMRARDLRQVSRLVGVGTTRACQRFHHRVKTLHHGNRVEIFIARRFDR